MSIISRLVRVFADRLESALVILVFCYPIWEKKKLYLKLLVRSDDFQMTYPIFEYEKTIQVNGKTNVHPKRCMLYLNMKLTENLSV